MSAIFVTIRKVIKQVLDTENISGGQILGSSRADTFNKLNWSLEIEGCWAIEG
jgi:hypothetical protein